MTNETSRIDYRAAFLARFNERDRDDRITEAVNYVPANAWMGRKPKLAPLTDSFIRAAAAGGSLVPPHDGVDGPWRDVVGFVIAVVGASVLAFALVVMFWR